MPALRAATSADLAAITRLLVASKLPIEGVSDILGASPTDFVVAEDPDVQGELVAVGGLERCESDALLRSVAVREAWRTHGLGRALIDQLFERARARQCRALYLLTTTAEDYFPRFGFARIDRSLAPPAIAATNEFTGACPAGATLMITTLE